MAPQPLEGPTRVDSQAAEKFGVLCHVRPRLDVTMSLQLPTTVKEVLVQGGQEVVAGQLLLRGDDTEELAILNLQKVRAEKDIPVQRAKAAMDLAEVEYKHLLEIRDKGGSGPQEVERARLTFETARLDYLNAQLQQTQEVLQVDRFQARVDRFRITAPFDGIVDRVLADAGQSVRETDPLVRLVRIDSLVMDVGADIGDARTWRVQVGDPAWVLVEVAGSAQLRTGKVTEVAPTSDLGSRTRRVRVEIANPKGAGRLLSGGPAWVRFEEPDAALLGSLRVQAAAASR
ncbi:MAG: efflux RND transporter periplasmic adaptor subunit [Planctomycetota bacterium]|nr:efflux RND transporter periplasmic adaptor subunit [Planctomycetota bacterium]